MRLRSLAGFEILPRRRECTFYERDLTVERRKSLSTTRNSSRGKTPDKTFRLNRTIRSSFPEGCYAPTALYVLPTACCVFSLVPGRAERDGRWLERHTNDDTSARKRRCLSRGCGRRDALQFSVRWDGLHDGLPGQLAGGEFQDVR